MTLAGLAGSVEMAVKQLIVERKLIMTAQMAMQMAAETMPPEATEKELPAVRNRQIWEFREQEAAFPGEECGKEER